MAFYIRSYRETDESGNPTYSFWSENGEPVDSSKPLDIVDFAQSFSTKSEAQSFIDSYKTNWVGFQKSIGQTFSVVEV